MKSPREKQGLSSYLCLSTLLLHYQLLVASEANLSTLRVWGCFLRGYCRWTLFISLFIIKCGNWRLKNGYEVSEGEALEETNKPKKKRSYGRIRDANERIRAQTFELGKPCLCKRLKCFEVILQVSKNVFYKILMKLELLLPNHGMLSRLTSCGLISLWLLFKDVGHGHLMLYV